jgi:hypothetical protein
MEEEITYVRQVVASLPTSDARLAEILEVSRRR